MIIEEQIGFECVRPIETDAALLCDGVMILKH